MNQYRLGFLIDKLFAHYERLGGYIYIPYDHQMCYDSFCKVLHGDSRPTPGDRGMYHSSLTVNPVIKSSLNGEILHLQPLNAGGLYWINLSQGSRNAQIVAHICSWEGSGERLYALVASPPSSYEYYE